MTRLQVRQATPDDLRFQSAGANQPRALGLVRTGRHTPLRVRCAGIAAPTLLIQGAAKQAPAVLFGLRWVITRRMAQQALQPDRRFAAIGRDGIKILEHARHRAIAL